MSEPRDTEASRLTRGSLLARNAYINLVGQLAPIAVAIFAIPLLIKVLGTERFGVLALAWVVMGYFGFFDFGLGRATTKFVAEYHARGETESIPGLVWSSLVAHVVLGLVGGGILALITPWLTQGILEIPGDLLPETRLCFYLLAISVPLIVATAALRGVLEAIQRFDLVNLIKIPASTLNYLGPLLVLYFLRGLVPVILFLVISRAIVLLAHLVVCLKALPELSSSFRFNLASLGPLFGFGGWLTVFSFIGPTIASVDRFVIGSVVSLSAVTYYTTPFEVVTKLTIFSTSLLSVLFPAFTAMTVNRSGEIRSFYVRALKYLLVLVAPIVGILLALAHDLLSLWVAPEFALDSAPVAKWLAVGILIHILAHVAFTVLQGVGRADVPAKLQLLQLPFYVLLVWYLAQNAGIVGVAIAWTLRATIDALMLFFAANKLLPARTEAADFPQLTWSAVFIVSVFLALFLMLGWVFTGELLLKVFLSVALLGVFLIWEWKYLLRPADRKAFAKAIRPVNNALK